MAGKQKKSEAEALAGGSLGNGSLGNGSLDNGSLDGGSLDSGALISNAKLQQLYATMLRCRLLSERARRLRKQNGAARLFAACSGHEAIAVGCAIDLGPADTVTLATHNGNAGLGIATLVKGVALSDLICQIYARKTSAPAATAEEQLDVATSVATTNKRKKSGNVVVVFTDAKTATMSYWNEVLAHAAGKKLPIIFVVENNRAGAAVAENRGDLGVTLKAQDKAVPRITVDGSDVVAVYRVSHESLARVRRGDGPALVEGTTYRVPAKTKSKHPDPLSHMEQYLATRKLFPAGWRVRLEQQFSLELDTAVKAANKALP